MLLFPNDLYEKLEFDKVIQLLIAECLGEPAQIHFFSLVPTADLKIIEQQLKMVKDLKLSLEKADKFPIANYYTIVEDVKLLPIEGYVLSVDSLQRINKLLIIFKDIARFFTPVRIEIYPTLHSIIRETPYNETLVKEIARVIDTEGKIKPDASPDLMKIRRNMNSKMREIESVYKSLISEFKQKNWLADSTETLRNGRRVLAVLTEHKRSLRGIIHDESATGRTTYIEPEAAIEVNNDLFDLEQEEKQEIFRIMRSLSNFLRPFTKDILSYEDIIIAFDVVHAKARVAQKMKANMPQLINTPRIGIRKGRHPLLYLKNKAQNKETIPFTLDLYNGNNILLVSGPNAGGKSVLMKSVGLMQLMVQSGLLVPVHELSEMGIYEKLFVNIGDSQSLEDDLSTYSSHLANMKFFLENADANTMVLIDEFGSGTDPKMGGAIAESILKTLNEKQVMGLVTTHYGNLKIFAYRTAGIINGCMNFDKDNLAPNYSLTIGRPGSSYAFEIATNVGFGGEVLRYAKKRIGENEQAVDELLIDLQREKQEYDEKIAELNEKQMLLDKLVKQYSENIEDVEARRKKQKLESKELELTKTAQLTQEMQRVLKELKQEKNIERAREITTEIKEKQQVLATQVSELVEEVYYAPNSKSLALEIKAGTLVKMRTGSATGRVETISGNEAIVVMGALRLHVKLRDLTAVEEKMTPQLPLSHNNNAITRSAYFDPKIDVRGLDMIEAERILQDFMDQAIVSSANSIRIVHGKGNGTLRKVVSRKLKEYKGIKKVYHPENNEGGDGVTMIEF